MIPAVAAEKLARFADVFCETGVYTVDESRAILTAARDAGLLLKLHADELTASGGAELAAALGATSADHLAAVSDDGIAALGRRHDRRHAASGHDALPRQDQAGAGARASSTPAFPSRWPPTSIRERRRRRTSRSSSRSGVSQLRLSVAEAVIAATVNGAAALALADEIGQIAPGLFGRPRAVRRSRRSRAAVLVRRQPLRRDVGAWQTLSP